MLLGLCTWIPPPRVEIFFVFEFSRAACMLGRREEQGAWHGARGKLAPGWARGYQSGGSQSEREYRESIVEKILGFMQMDFFQQVLIWTCQNWYASSQMRQREWEFLQHVIPILLHLEESPWSTPDTCTRKFFFHEEGLLDNIWWI